MLAEDLGTKTWNAIIQRGGRVSGKSEIDAMLEAGKAAKPADYDREQNEIAQMYSDRQYELTKKEVWKRYPNTASQRPIYTINTTRHSARLSAQAYMDAPRRFVEMMVEDAWLEPGFKPEGENAEVVLPEEAVRQRYVRDLEKAARLHILMPEWEERTEATTDHFCRFTPRGNRLEGALFFPHTVWALCHKDWPGRTDKAEVVIALLGGPRGATPLYEVVTRIEMDDGAATFAITHIDGDGEVRGVFPWPSSRSPWFSMHSVDPQGTLWHTPNYDQVKVNLAHNLLAGSFLFREDFQAHKQVFVTGAGDELDDAKLVGGPGRILSIKKTDARVSVVDAVLDKTPIEAAEILLRMQGNAKQQNPDSWASEPGNPPSGVSRDIRNIQSDRKRERSVALYTAFEEEDLLPGLAEIGAKGGIVPADAFKGPSPLRFRSLFPPPRRYEEPEARRLRWSSGMRDGAITVAEYAWRAFPEVYPSKQAAIDAGVPDVLLPIQKEAPASRAMIPGSQPPPVQQEGVAEVEGRRFGEGVDDEPEADDERAA